MIYGVSFVSISTEIDRLIKGFYCTGKTTSSYWDGPPGCIQLPSLIRDLISTQLALLPLHNNGSLIKFLLLPNKRCMRNVSTSCCSNNNPHCHLAWPVISIRHLSAGKSQIVWWVVIVGAYWSPTGGAGWWTTRWQSIGLHLYAAVLTVTAVSGLSLMAQPDEAPSWWQFAQMEGLISWYTTRQWNKYLPTSQLVLKLNCVFMLICDG